MGPQSSAKASQIACSGAEIDVRSGIAPRSPNPSIKMAELEI